jgi:hypothetical protein
MTKNNQKSKRIFIRNSQPSHPGQFKATASFRKIVRQQCITATVQTITAENLLDLHFIAATSVLGYRIVDAVKIHKVELWAPMPSSLVPVTVSIEWTGIQTGVTSVSGQSSQIFSDTSMGADRCAHVMSRPPAGSQAAFWQSGDSQLNVFKLNVPVNTIIDIEATFVLNDDETVQAMQNPVLVSATAATLYQGGIDGARVASSLWTPLSWLQA